ncbi:MAG: PepSY domain-containing protein [Candidatus Parcubacteria bacterium]|nr:PepSY domain-containing protein [Candidatus Parcubacteria bacterium]
MNKGISNISAIIVAVILMSGIGGYMYFKNKNGFGIISPIPNPIVEKSNQFMISKVGKDFFNKYISLDYSESKYSEADKFCIDNPNSCSTIFQKPYYFMVYLFKITGKPYINESISLNIDTNGNVIDEADIAISDCINNPIECEFPIDARQAIEIAKTAGLEQGIKEWETSFHWFAGDLKTFVWTVQNSSSEYNGRTVVIDANSGKVYQISGYTILPSF